MAVFWVVAPCSLVEGKLLHGPTTQKTAIFVLTAMRTSNPTKKKKFYSKLAAQSYQIFMDLLCDEKSPLIHILVTGDLL
jgi:hypothetical protein